MYSEEDLLPLSALQHLIFCERQTALIHIERIWVDNPLTVEGHHLHEKADSGEGESRGDVRIARGLALRCLRLGLTGKADVVEFHRLPSSPEVWRPFPVEYKRGKPKAHRADEVQLCAQALCLEEMLGLEVPAGALFYAQTRRRLEVPFDAELRRLTEDTAARLHRLFASGETPKAAREPKCDHCSLLGVCLPGSSTHSAQRYLSQFLQAAVSPEPGDPATPKTNSRRGSP
ncbi:MAG TPA: CRISPR-associated protein Cas4 [Thermoanaerobaculia bacterium]|nr:CRISPR-associated protein Cas4 [Thermoanaerobaculia bacterium]